MCESTGTAAQQWWSPHPSRDLKDVWMWRLGTWVPGAFGSGTVGLGDLRGFFQPQWFPAVTVTATFCSHYFTGARFFPGCRVWRTGADFGSLQMTVHSPAFLHSLPWPQQWCCRAEVGFPSTQKALQEFRAAATAPCALCSQITKLQQVQGISKAGLSRSASAFSKRD